MADEVPEGAVRHREQRRAGVVEVAAVVPGDVRHAGHHRQAPARGHQQVAEVDRVVLAGLGEPLVFPGAEDLHHAGQFEQPADLRGPALVEWQHHPVLRFGVRVRLGAQHLSALAEVRHRVAGARHSVVGHLLLLRFDRFAAPGFIPGGGAQARVALEPDPA